MSRHLCHSNLLYLLYFCHLCALRQSLKVSQVYKAPSGSRKPRSNFRSRTTLFWFTRGSKLTFPALVVAPTRV
jgi:hypothetical protein